MKPILLCSLLFCLSLGLVQCEDAQKSSGTSFSLEEIMLLADAAEKAQKKANGNHDDESDTSSNFQHRLKQLIQTARVAAGSGQSTGNDILDQTIRQVRARVNAGGGGVSDTSIFDAALKAFRASGAQSAPAQIVDTVVKQLSPEADPTTPAPQQGSFFDGILKQLANQGDGTDAKSVIIDAVVKQFVSTTTTTTTTTTTARPSPLQVLDGLVKAYQGRNTPTAPDGDSKQPAQPNVLNALSDLFQQLQTRAQPTQPPQPSPPVPDQPSDAKTPQSEGGSQIFEGLLNQLKQLQSRSQNGSSPTEGGPSGVDLGDALRQFQTALRTRFGTPAQRPSTTAPGDINLEGFEGLIPANGQATATTTTESTPAVPQSQPSNSNDALGKLFGGFVNQLKQNAGSQDTANLFKGFGELFNRNRQTK